MKYILSILIAAGITVSAFTLVPGSEEPENILRKENTAKIAGISLVGCPRKVDNSWVPPLQETGAEWVTLLPYAYCYQGSPKVVYNFPGQWWGESPEGIREVSKHAHDAGLKTMIKPQVWVPRAWPGSFTMASEDGWKKWEASYEKFILEIADIAEETSADMLCIGTEFKIAAKERPAFWRSLATKVRKRFSGKLTYAANWDSYENITWWSAVDYIGVDAYFPLSEAKTPNKSTLVSKWKEPVAKIKAISQKYDRKIIFTEYGYKSIDQAAWQQWDLENVPVNERVNIKAQVNAYNAIFEVFWDQPWFAGGFIWVWHIDDNSYGGSKNSDYTPQNKPVIETIKKYYER